MQQAVTKRKIKVHQGQRTVSSLLGGSVTLPCYFNLKSPLRMFWFKHVPGHEIKLIVSSFYNRVSFEEEVNKSKLDAETSDKSFNLTLKSIEASDEGSYLYSCTVQVQQHYLLDPASEGHNVTLNCTVVCGGCAGEHSVYWFRHGTPGSHPGIIYTHGDRSAGCEKNPEAGSSTQSCVYHLPKRNLSTTDAGTYHCAVAACGQITIGNGTKLEISSKKEREGKERSPTFSTHVTQRYSDSTFREFKIPKMWFSLSNKCLAC
uniref:Ig-like domain-containing protein n=1 Tax=Denticeps clupeoides TaxID=299321 RepID=A0AAY4DDC8_9TELE